jgi:hypothetical protein
MKIKKTKLKIGLVSMKRIAGNGQQQSRMQHKSDFGDHMDIEKYDNAISCAYQSQMIETCRDSEPRGSI